MKLSGFFILVCTCVYLMANYTTAEDHFGPVDTEDMAEMVSSGGRSIASVGKTKKEVFYKCTREKELRWIRLYYQKNGKCKTVYSKGGDAKEVSEASSYETCESVLNNIKKNLQDASYSCEEKILMGALELE